MSLKIGDKVKIKRVADSRIYTVVLSVRKTNLRGSSDRMFRYYRLALDGVRISGEFRAYELEAI